MLWSLSRCCCRPRLPDAYLIGGLAALPNDLSSRVDGYRNVTDAWTSRAPLVIARRLHAGTFTGGFGYALGGQIASAQTDDHDEYAPSSDSWAVRTAMPSPARNQLAAVGVTAEDGGRLYAFAGFALGVGDHVQNDEYDVASDSWNNRTSKPAPALRSPAYAEISGKTYAWGGFATTARVRDNDEYNPAADSWASRTDIPLPARDAMQGGGSISGRGYVLGGRSFAFPFPQTGVDNLDEYDPGGDSWTARGPSPVPRCWPAVCSSEFRIHGFGGNHDTTTMSLNHQCYEPQTETWITAEPIPASSGSRTEAAAFAV